MDSIPVFHGDPRQSDGFSQPFNMNSSPILELIADPNNDLLSCTEISLSIIKGNETFTQKLTQTAIGVFSNGAIELDIEILRVATLQGPGIVAVGLTGWGYQNRIFTLQEIKVQSGVYAANYQDMTCSFNQTDISTALSAELSLQLGNDSPIGTLSPIQTWQLAQNANDYSLYENSNSDFQLKILSVAGGINTSRQLEIGLIAKSSGQISDKWSLYETSPGTAVFTTSTGQTYYGKNYQQLESNDPAESGNGICYFRVPASLSYQYLQINRGDDQIEAIELRPDPTDEDYLISEPFIVLPEDSPRTYGSYRGEQVRNILTTEGKTYHAGKIQWNFAENLQTAWNNKSPNSEKINNGLYLGSSFFDMLPGSSWMNTSKESVFDYFFKEAGYSEAEARNLATQFHATIKAEKERAQVILNESKDYAAKNMKLGGNCHIQYLLWNDEDRLRDIVSRYDYILLTCHGKTRAPDGSKDGQRIPFAGLALIERRGISQVRDVIYSPSDIANMTLQSAPKLVFLSACGSAEDRSGSQAEAMWDAFRCYVYLGWDDEALMCQAAFQESKFFAEFKDKASVRDAVDASNKMHMPKCEEYITYTDNDPPAIKQKRKWRRAILMAKEQGMKGPSYTVDELKQKKKPTI